MFCFFEHVIRDRVHRGKIMFQCWEEKHQSLRIEDASSQVPQDCLPRCASFEDEFWLDYTIDATHERDRSRGRSHFESYRNDLYGRIRYSARDAGIVRRCSCMFTGTGDTIGVSPWRGG